MEELSRFGVLLKRYRQAARLSQEALAERAGLSPRAISDLERGVNRMPRNATFEALANALSLSTPQRDLLHAAAQPDLPPAEAPSLRPSLVNYPTPSTRLIGREHELEQAFGLLRRGETRLLTLTGPSGVGKTRLALELLPRLASSFKDGVVYVTVASIHEAPLVPGTVAHQLGLRGRGSSSSTQQIQEFLRDKHLLLVLDNIEQVLDCATFVADLLSNCPRLSILVTSRIPLHLRGEHELELLPIPIQDAVQLFTERAMAVRSDRTYPTSDVEAICEQLDRLPLAIELAAMHIKVLAIPELRKRLGRRLELLRGGPRDLPARQQTMEDAIAWSYELLTESQKRYFRALGVFVGGWTLEAAEAVCTAEGEASSEGAIATMAALVDASLVRSELITNGRIRFQMLDLIRDFASDRLRRTGEEETYRHRHAMYFARLADSASEVFGPGPDTLAAYWVPDFPNVRAALQWAAGKPEAELGLRLTGLARLWHVTGHAIEAEQWLERMLAIDAQARQQGTKTAPLALRIERLNGLGRVLLSRGEIERARLVATEALRLAESSHDERSIGNTWATKGYLAQARGSIDEAVFAFTESLRHSGLVPDSMIQTQALMALAGLAQMQGDLTRATTLLEQALAIAKARGQNWTTAIATTLLGHLARQQQNYALAQSHYRASLPLLHAFGSPTYVAWCLEGYAAALCASAQSIRAVHLLSAASHLREQAGTPLPPSERATVEQAVAASREALGEARFEQEWALGAELRLDDIVAEAVAAQPGVR